MARKGITFDLGLPDGTAAVLRFDVNSLAAMERELGSDATLTARIEAGQINAVVSAMLWAARLHQDQWTPQRAGHLLERYLDRASGDPPPRPEHGDRAARRAYKEAMSEWRKGRTEAFSTLRIALGDAMVEAGQWMINVFDPDQIDDVVAEDEENRTKKQPEDLSGVEVVGGAEDPTNPDPAPPTG